MFSNLTDHKKYVLFSYLTIGANIITGFILIPMILKKLGLDAVGVFGILFSLYSIIAIGLGWLSGSVVKNLTKFTYIKTKIFNNSFILNFYYGLFTLIIILVYGYMTKEDYLLSFFFFSFFSFISFLQIPFYNYLTSKLLQSKVAFYRFIQQILFTFFSIVSFAFYDKSLDIIFLILFLSSLFTFLLVISYLYKNENILPKLESNKAIIKRLVFGDGKSYFLNGMSNILLLQLDVILIDYLYGSESAGIYLILWKIPNTITMLGWRLSDPLQAIIAKNIKSKKEEIKVKFFSFEKKMLVLSFFLALGYALLGKWILEIWLGNENIPNLEYMYIIPAIVIAFSIMQRVYLSANYYTHGLDIITKLQFVEIIFKIAFIVFTFRYFNELAPIIGWFFAFLFTIYFYRKNSLKVLN